MNLESIAPDETGRETNRGAESERKCSKSLGLVFGGAEFGSQSTVLGQVVRVSGSSGARQAIAKMKFSTSLAAPVGILVWEIVLDTTSGVTAMFISATVAILVAFWISRLRSIQVV